MYMRPYIQTRKLPFVKIAGEDEEVAISNKISEKKKNMSKKVKKKSSAASQSLAREDQPCVVQQMLFVRNGGSNVQASNKYVTCDDDYSYELKEIEELDSDEMHYLYGRPNLVQTGCSDHLKVSHSQNDKHLVTHQSSCDSVPEKKIICEENNSSLVKQQSSFCSVSEKKTSCEENGKSLVKQQSSCDSVPEKKIICEDFTEVIPCQNGKSLVKHQSSCSSVPEKKPSCEENNSSLVKQQSSFCSVSENKTSCEENGKSLVKQQSSCDSVPEKNTSSEDFPEVSPCQNGKSLVKQQSSCSSDPEKKIINQYIQTSFDKLPKALEKKQSSCDSTPEKKVISQCIQTSCDTLPKALEKKQSSCDSTSEKKIINQCIQTSCTEPFKALEKKQSCEEPSKSFENGNSVNKENSCDFTPEKKIIIQMTCSEPLKVSTPQNGKILVVKQNSCSLTPAKKVSCEEPPYQNGNIVKKQNSCSLTTAKKASCDEPPKRKVSPCQNGNILKKQSSYGNTNGVKKQSSCGSSVKKQNSCYSASEKNTSFEQAARRKVISCDSNKALVNYIQDEPSVPSPCISSTVEPPVEPPCPKEQLRWSYYDKEDRESLSVHQWPSVYPVGIRQSPIDLSTKIAKTSDYIKYPTPLQFYYNCGDVFKALNTGTGVKFMATGTSRISGGPLGDEVFQLEQFHFHWGSNNSRGSEHFLNGEVFPAELHLVHYNIKYCNITEAIKHGDGLCVVGVFIGAQKAINRKYKPVTDMLKKVIPFKKEEMFNPDGSFNPVYLLPSDLQHFTFYPGSLTTPPLNESVLWINMLDPVDIGTSQLALFRKLTNATGKKIVDNYRPVQQLHDRKIMHQCPKPGH